MWEDDDDLDLSNIEFDSYGFEDVSSTRQKPNPAFPTLPLKNCSKSATRSSVFLDTNKKFKLSNTQDKFTKSFQVNQAANIELSNHESHHASKGSTSFAAKNAKCLSNETSAVSVFERKCKKVPSFLCNRDDFELDLDLPYWDAPVSGKLDTCGYKGNVKDAQPNCSSAQSGKTLASFGESADNLSTRFLDQQNMDKRTCDNKVISCNMNRNDDYSRVSLTKSSPGTPPDEQFSSAVNKYYVESTNCRQLIEQPSSTILEKMIVGSTQLSLVETAYSTATSDNSVRSQNLVSPLLTSVKSRTTRRSGSGRKRRFPGPAGLLPQLHAEQPVKLTELSGEATSLVASRNNADDLINVEVQNSQNSDDDFLRNTWLTMEEQLGLNQQSQSSSLTKYSITWLMRKANAKQLPVGKMPFLAAIIKSLIVKGIDGCVVLRDKTGEILGTVHRQLLEEFSDVMQVGSVLVLKQIGIFSPSNRRHYLNITRQNVLFIYSIQEDGNVMSNKIFDGNWCHIAKEVEEFSSMPRGLDVHLAAVPTSARTPPPFVKDRLIGPCLSNLRTPAIQEQTVFSPRPLNPSSATEQRTNIGFGVNSSTKFVTSQQHAFLSADCGKKQPCTKLSKDESKTNSAHHSSVKNFTFKPVDSLRNRSLNLLSQTPVNQKSSQLASSCSALSSKEVNSWQEDDLDKILEEISEEELLLGSGFATL